MPPTHRVPQIDLAAVLAQSHPSIDLKVQTFEDSSRNFLKALTSYKNRAITTISERRKHQAAEKKKVLERIQAVEKETNLCKLKEIDLVAQLEREKEERKDAELQVASFKRQLAAVREKSTSVDADIEQYRVLTQTLRRGCHALDKDKERSTLSSYSSHVFPELRACEEKLACSIEGVETDQLLIRFHRVDPSDPERVAGFVIDISTQIYKIITSSPNLPSMPILVNDLNETRNIYDFIREVRAAYANLLDTRMS
ncbi:putative kinetochore protein SPC25 [Psilocybe cubensis]|uniref:Kinetochore protein SPC25 n=2 Tax=Psilocybe cubensis TaxID=181762 RepID=A0ACB8GNL2_PSICU|nr:putative kinetochore protein SPC25 [Psilocybe cubensis]KAH9476992.1 putative kinetochore protein SPC25 [Psilocybe cubensis]